MTAAILAERQLMYLSQNRIEEATRAREIGTLAHEHTEARLAAPLGHLPSQSGRRASSASR